MVCVALVVATAATAMTADVAAAGPPDISPQHIATDPGANVQQVQVQEQPEQPIADPVAPPPHRHGDVAIMAVAGGGTVGAKDIHGGAYAGRFEVDAYPVFPSADRPGALVGFGYGFEYWRAGPDNWGFALPCGFQVGARVGAAHAALGAGIYALVVDQIDDDTGAGSYAPYANAQLGLHLGQATVIIDGRIDRRWLAGAADRTQWSLGVMIGITQPGL